MVSMNVFNTLRLWWHATCPVTFSLVVDTFGIKYVGKEHANHLIKCLKKYKLTKDWICNLYCGITLKWDYKARTLDVSVPGYIKKQLVKYKRIQNFLFSPEPKKFGVEAQSPLPIIETCKLTNAEIKRVQKIVGSILYYARAVDMTVLMALSTITSKTIKGPERMLKKTYQVLDYLVSHPNATVRLQASDIITNIHLDAFYLSKLNACSRACGHFFMGNLNSTGCFTCCVLFCKLSWHQRLKPNWVLYS